MLGLASKIFPTSANSVSNVFKHSDTDTPLSRFGVGEPKKKSLIGSAMEKKKRVWESGLAFLRAKTSFAICRF